MRSNLLFTGLLFVFLYATGVDGVLFCFKCLNIDCNEEDLECQGTRAFVQSELRDLYHFRNYLDPCPKLNETSKWRLMQISDEPCPEEKPGEATCTLGRMQIQTATTTVNGKTTVKVNHATVLGCANRNLLRRVQNAFEQNGNCDYINRTQSGVGVVRDLQIEHCRELSSQCYEDDYCIDWKKSVVKEWQNHKTNRKFEFLLIVGLLALALIVISALLLAGMFREPQSRPSNLPRTIGDEMETVKVLKVQEKEECSIEDTASISISSGTASIGRRPTVPPPPPPRLRPPRGSTPV